MSEVHEENNNSLENTKKETSLNIGICAFIVLVLTISKDFLNFFGDIEGLHVNGIVGTIAIFSCLFVLKFNLSSKFKNQEKLAQCLDLCTFFSVIIFALENGVLDFVEKEEKILIAILLIAIVLAIVAAIIIFFIEEHKASKK